MKTVINGISMGYDDSGSGPPVILLHGFPLNRRMWTLQTRPLAEAGFRVIAPDLRGFGETDAPHGPYSMSLFADDVVALMDHLSIDKAVICGMSMGGYVLLNLLERYRERFMAACFITTRVTCDDETVRAGRLALLEKVKEDGIQTLAELFTSTIFTGGAGKSKPDVIRQIRRLLLSANVRGMEGALHAMLDRADDTPLLRGFTLPCLVIGAELDRTVSPDDIRTLAAGLPDGELCMIPGAGHMVNLEKPEDFNGRLLDFLRRVARPDASGCSSAAGLSRSRTR